MKERFNQDRRKNFVSTLTETPHQFTTFTATLQEVLSGKVENISELKKSAKVAESFILGRIGLCDDIGFYAFHAWLLDIFETWQPVIKHIRRMSVTTTTRNIKELRMLRMHCTQDTNIPEIINFCYQLQEDIVKTLSDPNMQQEIKFCKQQYKYDEIFDPENIERSAHRSTTTTLGKEMFAGQDDVFGDDTFNEKILSEDAEREKKMKGRNMVLNAFAKTHILNSKRVLVPKSTFRGIKEKLDQKEEDR